MRLTPSAILTGTLGAIAQTLTNGVNALNVRLYGGVYADEITDQLQAFHGGATGNSANKNHIQLINPSGSLVSVYVDSVFWEAIAANNVDFCRYDTACANLATSQVNKSVGGAAPVAQIRQEANASSLGTVIFPRTIGAANTQQLNFSPPLKLAAAQGVLVRIGGTSQVLNAYYQWRER